MNGYSKCWICGSKKSINGDMVLCPYVGEWICNDHKEIIALLIRGVKDIVIDPARGVLKILATLAGIGGN